MKATLKILLLIIIAGWYCGCKGSNLNPPDNNSPSSQPTLPQSPPLDEWLKEVLFDTVQLERTPSPSGSALFCVHKVSCAKQSGIILMDLTFATDTAVTRSMLNGVGNVFYPKYTLRCCVPYTQDEKLVEGVYTSSVSSFTPYWIESGKVEKVVPELLCFTYTLVSAATCMQITQSDTQGYTIEIWMKLDNGVSNYICMENLTEGKEVSYYTPSNYYPCD